MMKARAFLLALYISFVPMHSHASFWDKLKTIGGAIIGCEPWTHWYSKPGKTADVGGKSTSDNPLIDVEVSYYGGCSHGKKKNTITLGQTWTTTTAWTGSAYLKVTSGSTACCNAGDKVYTGNSYSSSNTYCTVPNYETTFSKGACGDCSCDDAKTLSDAYGCSMTKTYSYFCSKQIPFESVCVMAKNDETVFSAFEQLTTYGCWPIPQGMSPPMFCSCNLPGAPMPEAVAYPICTLSNPASIYSSTSGTQSTSYTSNNCALLYQSDTTTYAEPTYQMPYARVQFSNPMAVKGWASSDQNALLTYCDSTALQNIKGGFVANCNGPCQGKQNCVSGSSGTTAGSGYVATSGQSPSKEEYSKIFLFGSSSQDITAPKEATNIALTNKPVGGTYLTPYGVNVSQFGDIAFDFSALTNDSNSNCGITNASNIAECAGSKSLTLIDNQHNARNFATYLPAYCNTSNDSASTPSAQCSEFCVAETFIGAMPQKIGCFSRPLPKQGLNLGICTNDTSNCSYNSLTATSETMGSTSNPFPEYNSNSKWCYELQVESSKYPLCGENSFSKQSGAELFGNSQNTLYSIFTNLTFQYPQLTTTNYCFKPIGGSQTNCTAGTLKYWGYDTSNPSSTSFSSSQKSSNTYNLMFSNASLACPIGLPKQDDCSKACQQNPDNPNEWYGTNSSLPCNCILAPNNFCSPSNQMLASSYPSDSTNNPCAGASNELVPSPLPQQRITAPPKKIESVSTSSDLKNLVTLSQDAYIAPTQSFVNTENTRSRTVFESGHCVPLTMWDPVDCTAMYGSSSDFTSDVNNNKISLAKDITATTFYDACQNFVCDYCTVNGKVNSSISPELQNDYYYIQERCNNIYQKCALGSTVEESDLINPSFLQSASQSTYSTANNNIKKIADVYGYNSLCSFFQPGKKGSTARTSADCTSADKVQDSNSKSVSYCGCFAPGNAVTTNNTNTGGHNNGNNTGGGVGGVTVSKNIPINSDTILKVCDGSQNCMPYYQEYCSTLGSGISAVQTSIGSSDLCCSKSNNYGGCIHTSLCKLPKGYKLPDQIYKDSLVNFMMDYEFSNAFCLYQLALECQEMGDSEVECNSKDGTTFTCSCPAHYQNRCVSSNGVWQYGKPGCNSSAPVVSPGFNNLVDDNFAIRPTNSTAVDPIARKPATAMVEAEVGVSKTSSSSTSFTAPTKIYCYDAQKNTSNSSDYSASKLPNVGSQFSKNIPISGFCSK